MARTPASGASLKLTLRPGITNDIASAAGVSLHAKTFTRPYHGLHCIDGNMFYPSAAPASVRLSPRRRERWPWRCRQESDGSRNVNRGRRRVQTRERYSAVCLRVNLRGLGCAIERGGYRAYRFWSSSFLHTEFSSGFKHGTPRGREATPLIQRSFLLSL